jgi:hypothetical protein
MLYSFAKAKKKRLLFNFEKEKHHHVVKNGVQPQRQKEANYPKA